MTWNYRLLERKDEDDDKVLEIVEVYYDDEHRPLFWSQATAIGDDNDEVMRVLFNMIGALSKPMLSEDDFKGGDT